MIGFVFFILFIPLLIILGLAYFRTKKIYPLMYILSAFSYIITLAYFIGAWGLKKDAIIATLGVSAILLIAIGYNISHSKKQHELKRIKRYGIVLPITIIVFASIIGSANIGMERQTETVSSVKYSEIFSDEKGKLYINTPGNQVLLQTITIKNSLFLSVYQKIPRYTICFYPLNESCDVHSYPMYYENNKSFYKDIIEILPRSEKTVQIRIPKLYNYEDRIGANIEPVLVGHGYKGCNYDEILLIDRNPDGERDYGFVECSSLSKEQIDSAIKIEIN